MKRQEEKMISGEVKSHQKHAALKRPQLGQFGRNEIAILGTPCGNIKQLTGFLVSALEHLGPLALVDADHKASEPDQSQTLNFVDKINYRRFDYLSQFNPFQLRPYFNQAGLVLVNGNHFTAFAQIVVIDPKKPLDRKLDRLTNPVLVIKSEPDVEIPDYLLPYTENLPVLEWEQKPEIAGFIETWLSAGKPTIKGLVLAGGKSVRMQRDKGALKYHGVSQRKYVSQQLQGLGLETVVSCRQDQLPDIENDTTVLLDTFQGLGPMGALLSAFREDPDAAWLAVACDLPFLTTETLEYLVSNRDTTKVATAFQSPVDEFPEPLITIWEPKSYSVLLSFLSQGYSCPRKVLINSDIKLLQAPEPRDLTNVNHPDEYEKIISDLKSRISEI